MFISGLHETYKILSEMGRDSAAYATVASGSLKLKADDSGKIKKVNHTLFDIELLEPNFVDVSIIEY